MKHVELRLSRCYHVGELYGKYSDCRAPYHDGDCSEACGGFLFCEICLNEIAPMGQYALVGVKHSRHISARSLSSSDAMGCASDTRQIMLPGLAGIFAT